MRCLLDMKTNAPWILFLKHCQPTSPLWTFLATTHLQSLVVRCDSYFVISSQSYHFTLQYLTTIDMVCFRRSAKHLTRRRRNTWNRWVRFPRSAHVSARVYRRYRPFRDASLIRLFSSLSIFAFVCPVWRTRTRRNDCDCPRTARSSSACATSSETFAARAPSCSASCCASASTSPTLATAAPFSQGTFARLSSIQNTQIWSRGYFKILYNQLSSQRHYNIPLIVIITSPLCVRNPLD